MKNKTVASLVIVIGATAAPCMAQWGYGGFGYGSYSSTLQEGAQRGFADTVRSAGMANLYNSQAAVNAASAENQALDNDLKYARNFFTIAQMNHDFREAYREKPPTSEQAYRWAHRAAPKALNSYEFDPLTGQINWPLVLQDTDYDGYRIMAEQFFKERAQRPQNLNINSYMEFHELIDTWLADLKSHISKYKPNDYLKSRSLLESLGAEASKS
jgi:hypothetical protein